MFAKCISALPGFFLLTALWGCSSAMKTTIVNQGVATVELGALCGDAAYQTTLLAAGVITWTPFANSCSILVKGPSTGRQLTIRNECLHTAGCSLGVTLPGGTSTRLAGSGQLAIVEEVVTPSPGPGG